jgi:hypothetical protein
MSTWTRLRELLAAVMGPVLVLLGLRQRPALTRQQSAQLVQAMQALARQARGPRQLVEVGHLVAHLPRELQAQAMELVLEQIPRLPFGSASPINSASSAKTAPSTKRRRRPR